MVKIINPREAVALVFTDDQKLDMEALNTKDTFEPNFIVSKHASRKLQWKTAIDVLENIAVNDKYLYKTGGASTPHLRSAILACIDRVKRG